ncbi:hypothetical protein Tco_0171264 [Tanacetum coccineum]
MNFMIVRSLSPNNGIIGRHGIREIQAVPSTAYEMLKLPVNGGMVTIYSTILILAEYATVITSSKEIPKEAEEGYLPVRQKKRGQAPEHAKTIQAEHDGSWRICVDFTDLNKACPQDCYPLLEIDWKIESLYGYPFKCFLDAYKGYHQI